MATIGEKAKSAVLWNTGFNVFRDALQFLTMLVLVRLLMPEEYGQFSLVTSIVGFISVFSHNSFLAYTLQVQDKSDLNYQDHFTASSVIQISLFLIANFVGLIMHWLPQYAAVAKYIHVLSVTFLLEWPCELRRKMLERDFDWRRLRILQAIGLLIGAGLAPLMAYFHFGTYALIVPGLFVTIPFIYDLFYGLSWRPTWEWKLENYRPALRFGFTRLGSGLLNNGRLLAESASMTAIIGFAEMGLFGRATGLSQIFCQKFASQLLYALYPLLTRINGKIGSNQKITLFIFQIIAWTSIPVAVFFSIFASSVIALVYGKNWIQVSSYLPAAMYLAVLSAIMQGAYMTFMSSGGVKKCLVIDFINTLMVLVSLIFALPLGLNSYLFVQCVIQTVIVSVILINMIRLGLFDFSGIYKSVIPPIVASSVSWLAILAFAGTVKPLVFNDRVMMAAGCLIYMVSYFAVIRIAFCKELVGILRYVPAHAVLFRILVLK